AGVGAQHGRAVSVADEIQPFAVTLDAAVHDRGQRVLVKENELWAAVRRSQALLLRRHTEGALEYPEGFDVVRQLGYVMYEYQSHVIFPYVSSSGHFPSRRIADRELTVRLRCPMRPSLKV